MQNKGFVKFLAWALAAICVFYLSFSIVTNYVENKAAQMPEEEREAYLDSLETHPFYLWNYNLKQCRETAIGLGLDLKGGMNVMLEVSVPDVVKALADNKQDEAFVKSVAEAQKKAQDSQSDFITLFVESYHKNAPGSKLASIFATQQLKGKVNIDSSDADVVKVLRAEIDAAVDNSYRVLRTRIDRFGVVQPNIQKVEGQSGRIMVELPGIKEPERVRKLLQGSANLEFWETYKLQEIQSSLTQLNTAVRLNGVGGVAETADSTAVDSAASEVAEAAVDSTATKASASDLSSKLAANNAEATAAETQASAEAIKKARAENPLFALFAQSGQAESSIVAIVHKNDTAAVNAIINSKTAKDILPTDLRLLWGVKSMDKAGKFFELYAIRTSGGQNGKAPLEGDVISDAKDDFDNFGRPVVSMKMNTEGARKWGDLTGANVNRSIAIVLDGYVYSAPNVNEKISGGSSQISGNFTTTDTKDLANVLSSGKMPAPATIVQEDIVGPSLGEESIRAGFVSFVIAFIVLMVYMCMMYGVKVGMVANGALILNFFFTLGILTSLQAALTMSGIAGMVLTLGTAVDANVLIYERTREELRAGKKLSGALAAGYNNAFSAIFDSNLTSIITAVILFYFGTGPIKGFATTLFIGILCSFFTAVWLTRIVYERYVNRGKWQELTFETSVSKNIFRDAKYNILGQYKKSFAIFGIIIAASAVSFFVRGMSRSIDFTGGRNYKVEFIKPVSVDKVRDVLNETFAAKNTSGEAINTSVIALGTDGKNVRVSTNFRIKESGANVDADIEAVLYEAFVKGGMIDGNAVSLEHFVDRDNREGGSIISSAKVGPSVAEDITFGAVVSVILALIAIGLYILLRFRNVAYSLGALAALVVDTLVILGVYSLCYGWIGFSLEIDQTFIGAILTAIGYSINDKVVVFDRIRENRNLYPKRDVRRVFNDSVNQTLTRTVNTSVSTLIVLVAIFIFGGDSIRSFSFAMILGVVGGTLTSIFIATPVASLVLGKRIQSADEEVAVAEQA
jgi:SecD/SecF fusion protein